MNNSVLPALDAEKINICMYELLREYSAFTLIDELTQPESNESGPGSFRQIVTAVYTDKGWFLADTDRVPSFMGLGLGVANGETNFLFNEIKNKKLKEKVNPQTLPKPTASEIIQKASDYGVDVTKSVLIIPFDKFHYEFYKDDAIKNDIKYDNQQNRFYLSDCNRKLFLEPIQFSDTALEDYFRNKLIIIQKDAIKWWFRDPWKTEQRTLDNIKAYWKKKSSDRPIQSSALNRVFVSVGYTRNVKRRDTVDILLKTVINCKIVNPDKILIFEL